MTYLEDLVEPFKREVAIPGTFSAEFPYTSDEDIEAALADAFGQAQLDGFFPGLVLDVDAGEVSPDLSVAGAALVVIYAGVRMVRQKLRALGINRRYKAGPVEVETSVAASLLTQELKDLQQRLNNIVVNASRTNRPSLTFMLDGYHARLNGGNYGGFYGHEIPVGSPLGSGELVQLGRP